LPTKARRVRGLEILRDAYGHYGRGRGEAIVEPDGDAAQTARDRVVRNARNRHVRKNERSAITATIRPNIDAITLSARMCCAVRDEDDDIDRRRRSKTEGTA